MSTQSLPNSTISSGSTKLRGGLLLIVSLIWLVLVLLAVGLFMRGIPFHADDLRERYQAKVGAFFLLDPSGNVLISPWLHFPASQAGILEGDILLAVNGKPVALPRDAPDDFLKNLIRIGPAGTPVTLQVRTGNHPPREYRVILGGEDAVAVARLGLSKELIANYAIVIETVFALVCLGIAGVIFLRKSKDWFALLSSLTFILLLLGVSENTIFIYMRKPVWRPVLDLWFIFILFDVVMFFCLFPDGRFVSRWILIVPAIGVLWIMAQGLNPLLIPWKTTFQKGFGMIVIWLSFGLLVQFYRYRYHANSVQRQQTKWVMFGMLASTIGIFGLVYNTAFPAVKLPSGMPAVLFDLIGYPVIQLFMLFLPLTIAVAILRYRLWDIDIIINRTLVYGALTLSVIGIYVLVVGILGTTIQGRANLLVSILAIGLVALLVQPLRDRLQRGVNRMMYGERDDPVTVLSRLGQRLEATLAPDAVLPSLVETVAQTLKLPYVAIETMDHRADPEATDDSLTVRTSRPTIAYGQPQLGTIRLPLIYQSETIGQLVVAPRAPGEPLSPMDRHLLENIAHQAGMAVHAVSLTADLQRSRQRLVTTREEERRRLRRDLHDGLGPNLASQGLKLAAVKQLLEKDPASAIPLLDQVMAQNQTTVEEIRRLVYDLRPPALDELGLVAAIRDYVAGMDGKSTLQIEVVESPEGLPALPAAVEVAAYRIVLEALTNVIRHARAGHCTIRFAVDQTDAHSSIQVDIQDNGIGLSDYHRAGVGTRSMRERAEELGGTCNIASTVGRGTRVCVRIPFTIV